jgi:hypothetical protein
VQPTSLRPITPAVVALTTTSEQSSALGAANAGLPSVLQRVRVVATVDCWIAEGSNPTAASNGTASLFLPAATVEYFNVPLGNKIAGVVADGTGTLSVTIMG